MDGFLQIRSATKMYRTPEGGSIRALDDVTLHIRSNEFISLLGPSGCGKTTLLKCIAGFEDLDHGDITLTGQSLTRIPAHRRPFNTVFQNYALFPHLTVERNVAYGLDVAHVERKERTRRVGEALEQVGLAGFGARMPNQLSGGQQQRVAVARSLVLKPKVLLLDEPLSALDRKMRESMQIELKSLQHSVGITFIFVTHDQEEALSMSDRVAVLASGKVQQLASPKEIYDEPQNEFVANFVGTSNIFKGKVIAKEGRTLTLKTANGRELAVASDRFGVGDDACAVLRPEHLKLSGEARDRAIKGTVTQSVFVGSEMHLHVDVGHLHVDVGLGRTAVVRHRHNKGSTEAAYGPGADVTLYYTPEAAHVIECKGA